MFLFASLLLAQIFLVHSAFGQEIPPGCQVLSERRVSPLPVPRVQGLNPFCSSIALATVLDQIQCSRVPTTEGCSEGSPIFSTLDIASRAGDRILNGPHANTLINAISGQRIARESCAPLVSLTARDEFSRNSNFRVRNPVTGVERSATREESDLLAINELKKLWQRIASVPQESRCSFASGMLNQVTSITHLQVTLQQVTRALLEQSEAQFISRLMVPPRCEDSSIQLPRLSSSAIEAPEKGTLRNQLVLGTMGRRLLIEPRLTAEIDANRAFVWNLLQTPGDSSSGHAVAVLGYRMLCCSQGESEVCRQQFLARDSQTVISSQRGDTWLDAEEVSRKAAEYETSRAECIITFNNGRRASCLNAFSFVRWP